VWKPVIQRGDGVNQTLVELKQKNWILEKGRQTMKQLAPGSLIVALLLASLGTASAECAWVLWTREIAVSASFIDEKAWQILRAIPTYDACESAQAKTIKNIEASYARRDGARASVLGDNVIVSAPGMSLTHYFRCLPDTIDPRGPKAR